MVSIKLVRNDGKEFKIDGEHWKLYGEIQGISNVNIELTTAKNLSGSGSIVTTRRIGTRDVTFNAVNVKGKPSDMRAKAIVFFNPEYTYTMFITYQGITRRLPCELYKYEIPAENVHRMLKLQVTMLATDPFFTSESDNSQFLGKIKGRIGFPYVSIVNKGFVVSNLAPTKSVKVINDGVTPTGYSVHVNIIGNVTNPTIFQDDLPFKIYDTFEKNDTLDIDFESAIPKVRKNGVNIIQKVDRFAEFSTMKLRVGETQLSYTAESGENNMQINIRFYKKYLGV